MTTILQNKTIFPPFPLTAYLTSSILFYLLLSNTNLIPANNPWVQQISSFALLSSIGLIILYKPIWGLSIIALFLPLQSIWPDITKNFFSGIPFITSFIVIIGFFTVGSTTLHIFDKTINIPKFRIEHLLAFIFVVYIGINNYITIEETTGRIWFWTYLQLLLLMVLGTILIRNIENIKVFGYPIIIGTIISILGGVLDEGFVFSTEASFRYRLAGLSGGANEFAIMCVISLVLLNFFIPTLKSAILRFILILCVPVLFFGLVFSISRTGLVATVAVLILILISKYRLQFGNLLVKSLPIAFLAVGFALAILLTPNTYRNLWIGSVFEELNTRSGTTGIRIEVWRIAFKGYSESPIFGIGVGNFRKYAENEWSLTRLYNRAAVHNTYLSILCEMGIFGLLLFIGWNALIFIRLILYNRIINIDPHYKNFAYMLLLILIVWAVFGLFSNGEYGKILWLVNGASLGLLSATHTNNSLEPPEPQNL